MNKTLKIILIALSILTIIFTFLWLASFFFRLAFSSFDFWEILRGEFKLNPTVRTYPFDIVLYTIQYAGKYTNQLKIAWIGSLMAHLLIASPILYLIFKKNVSLYGEARFARYKEIAKAGLFLKNKKNQGLFADSSIIVGKFANKFLALGEQMFVFLAAPTRSGKGVGVVIPVGLSYDHSMVVLDIKQELYEITSGFRAKCGQEIYLFNPFSPDGKSSRWNPLNYIRREEHLRIDDINQIGISLFPAGKNDDDFFANSARTLFVGLVLYLLDKEKNFKEQKLVYVPTIKDVLTLATDFEGEAIPYFQSLTGDKFLTDICKRTLNSVASSGEKTFASILATLTTGLQPWLSETVSEATSGDDFDLRDMRRKRMTIYLGIMPRDLAKASKILNLFFSQLINENTEEQPTANNSLKYQCLILMDEATAPGYISILPKAVSYMASFNMRLLLIVQSPSQLREIYGEHNTETLLTNMGLRILYTAKSVKDSEEYSKLLGKTTIKDWSSSTKNMGKGRDSKTQATHSRDLMLPQEFRQLSNSKEIISYEGVSFPIQAEKITYYTDKEFKKRYQNFKPAKFTIGKPKENSVKLVKNNHVVVEVAEAIYNLTIN